MDMKYACVTLVKSVQQIHYGEIISKLKHKDKPQTERPPIIQQLGLYLDENNLIRCKGRLQNTQLPYNAKYTVMIPAESYLATLIVRDTHLIVLLARWCTRHLNSASTIVLDPQRQTTSEKRTKTMRDL